MHHLIYVFNESDKAKLEQAGYELIDTLMDGDVFIFAYEDKGDDVLNTLDEYLFHNMLPL